MRATSWVDLDYTTYSTVGDMLDAFAVTGTPEEIPKLILDRYGDIVDRVLFYAPYKSDPERWARILADFKSA